MARPRIPDHELTKEQKKRRERNERYRQKRHETLSQKKPTVKPKIITEHARTSQTTVSQIKTTSQTHLHTQKPFKRIANQTSQSHTSQTDELFQSSQFPQMEVMSQMDKVSQSKKSSQILTFKKGFDTSLNSSTPQDTDDNIGSHSIIRSDKYKLFSWRDFFWLFSTPVNILLMFCITGMTGYLIYQGLLFFSYVEVNALSAITNAIISEAIPILSAACLTLCTHRLHKLAAGFILIVTITGLSLFMHTSIAGHMTKESSQFSRLDTDRNLILETIQTLNASAKALPDTFLTKKQQLFAQMKVEKEKLSSINQKLNNIETTQSNVDPLSLSYSVWLRIAAMLMNTLLVHLFFGRMASLIKVRTSAIT